MKLKLKRRYKGTKYTIGSLFINGQYFCDTLEDTIRDFGVNGEGKIYAQTAIPSGTYDVTLAMSPKFGRKLPLLLNVPYFSGILIHRGNSAKDSAGCVLLGENKARGKVLNSTVYETKIVELMEDAEKRNEKITIEIKN